MPWNMVLYSEQFDNGTWGKLNTTVTANTVTAPNGTTTADSIFDNAVNGSHYISSSVITVANGSTYTLSAYLKANTLSWVRLELFSGGCFFDLTNGVLGTASGATASITSVGGGWYRCAITVTSAGTTAYPSIRLSTGNGVFGYAGTGKNIYAWGAQLVLGSSAKDYFQTTDRQDVPRLTYQNGGGGCPSLLLEPQRTNIIQYSTDLANAYYVANLITVTNNFAVSPDGNQNASNISFTASIAARLEKFITGTFNNQSHTVSVYAKVSSGTQTFRLKCSHAGVADYISNDLTATTDWQRFTFTASFGASAGTGIYAGIQNGTNATAKNIQFYGLQLETNSSYATTLIPTQGANVTRIADSCFKTGISSLIGQTEGFIFGDVEGLTNYYGALSTILSVSDGTTQNRVIFSFNPSTGYLTPRIYKAGSTLFVEDYYLGTLTNRFKFAIGYGAGRAACYINGTQVKETTGLTFFSSGTLTRLGADQGEGGSKCIGKINQYVIGTVNLTNSELASLTTL
jgi:hypothetical protein